MPASVGRQDGVDPGAELGDTGIDSGYAGAAGAAAPGDDAHQGPGAILLTHQRAPGVALQAAGEGRGWGQRGSRGGEGLGALTLQEEAPSAPAHTITSLMRNPQYALHCTLLSRGRATCCSTAGVDEAMGEWGGISAHRTPGAPGTGMGIGIGMRMDIYQVWGLGMIIRMGFGDEDGYEDRDEDEDGHADKDRDGGGDGNRKLRYHWGQ